jgi:hypothetical protein
MRTPITPPNTDLPQDMNASVDNPTLVTDYLEQLTVRGIRLHMVPQPYGASVAQFIRKEGRRLTNLPELVAHLLRDLDEARKPAEPEVTNINLRTLTQSEVDGFEESSIDAKIAAQAGDSQ